MQNLDQVDVNLNIRFAFNVATHVYNDSEDKLFIYLRLIIKKTEKKPNNSYFGFGSGSGSLRARPTGYFSASSTVTRWNSASTFPWWRQRKAVWKGCSWAGLTVFSSRTVSSPDLMKGHQPLLLFCWKMETFSILSVNISALHDFAVLAPRGKLWRSNSTVPTRT